MSALRRSARIANRNASKLATTPISKPINQCNPVKTPSHASVLTYYWDDARLHVSDWDLEYTLYDEKVDMKDPKTLQDHIAHHEKIHKNDACHAHKNSNTDWERELMVATRWLCIDNRILKASPEMLEKATMYAWTVNDSLPALYAQIDSFKEQLLTLRGYQADKISRRLMMSNLLLKLADHVHRKWNMVMHELDEENHHGFEQAQYENSCVEYDSSSYPTSRRRSARIASKNGTSKPSQPYKFPIFTGPGWSGKSPIIQALRDSHHLNEWHVEYKLFVESLDMTNAVFLPAMIEYYQKIHSGDKAYAKKTYDTEWERELMVAGRWLCIDNRILKASPEMLDKATTYASKIHSYLPALHEQIKTYEDQLEILSGYLAGVVHRRLLMSNLLLELAEHGHRKWGMVMQEMKEESDRAFKKAKADYLREVKNGSANK